MIGSLALLLALAGPIIHTARDSVAFARRTDSLVHAFMRKGGLPGIALGVIREGRVVYAKGYGVTQRGTATPITPRTVFHMASVTKPFVATGIMQLQEQGKIDLDAPVTRYIPYFTMKDPRFRDMTIKQMLNHTSGMPDVTDYAWDRPQYDDGALDRWVRSLADSSLIFAPGARWQYSNIAFEVLADVIAAVSGETFEDYIQHHVLTPVGMRHSTLLMTDVDSANLATGHVGASPGTVAVSPVYPYNRRHAASSTLHSNVDDMLRWALVNLQRGELDGRRILAPASYGLMWTPTSDFTPLYRRMTKARKIAMPYSKVEVGLSWFLFQFGRHRLVNHDGGDTGFRTALYLDPDTQVAVVVLANAETAEVDQIALPVLRLVLAGQ